MVGTVVGRALQHARFNANAARAAITLPEPVAGSGVAPAGGIPNNFDLGKSGVPFQTPAAAFYRIDTALSVPQLDPKTLEFTHTRQGESRDHADLRRS